MVKEVSVSAKQGGSDPSFNPKLRLAIQNAKGANVPKDAILRAINNTTEKDQKEYSEVTYEGYGSHGVAIIVVCMTDKITRTVASIRATFSRYGGRLEKSGALAFLFDHKGCFSIPITEVSNIENIALELIDVGGDVVDQDTESLHIACSVEDFGKVQKKLEELSLLPTYSGLDYFPNTFVELSDEVLPKLIKLVDALEEDDDVQNVYHNIAIQTDQEQFWS